MLKYLLSTEEFLEEKGGQKLLERALAMVDAHRREKALKLRHTGARALSLGGGLLLQLAVRESLGKGDNSFHGESETIRAALPGQGEKRDASRFRAEADPDTAIGAETGNTLEKAGAGLVRLCPSRILECLGEEPFLPLVYRYGSRGKPYLTEYPFYFNLSHSGQYVVCALGREEMGADIQVHRGKGIKGIARRFFSSPETEALSAAASEADAASLFYRLWARKEAYGKLNGSGIGEALGVNLLTLPERTPEGRALVWEEYRDIPECSIAFCRFRTVRDC